MIKLRTLTITAMIAIVAVLALMAPAPAGAGGITFVVNSNGDAADASLNGFCDTVAGPPQTCTLRAAIQEANFSPNNDFINFSNGSGQFTISTNSTGLGALPAITDGVWIDGTTQPGYDPGNPAPMVELRGTAQIAGDGLTNSGHSTLIRGLALTDFPDAGISFAAGSNTRIEGSYLGLGLDGATVLGNLRGIEITGGSGALIGGDTAAERNVISGNSGLGGGDGILVTGGTSTQIKGNYIGLDADGVLDVGNVGDGIEIITAGAVTIGGSVPAERNVISGNEGSGIVLNNSSGNNSIHGNYIGTDVTGTLDLGNSFSGVRISDSPNNDVGGGSAGQGNLISGNEVAGVAVSDTESENNEIEGNLIGTNAAGTGFIRNTDGVQVSGAVDTFIGTSAAARNVISGNLDDGVQVSDSSGTRILGNYIGTDITGAADLGNGANGVQLFGTGTGTIIGATGAGNGNVISGNNGTAGILMLTNSNSISSNIIGLNAAGTAAIPNNVGVSIGGSSNTVGGSLAGQGNVISGNSVNGINLSGPGNFVRGNIIGLDPAGSVDRGNTLSGIVVSSANNNVGGTTAESRNLISGNNAHGVEVSGDASDGNFILGNYIGTDITGTLDRGNSLDGVHIDAGDLNTIGGTETSHRNIISGNNSDGVELSNDANTNVIRSNYIGTDVTGTLDRGNSAIGINVLSSDNNTIGTSGRANVISGNGQDGIEITSASLGNLVQANQIGLASDGVSPLGNGTNGIQIAGSSSNQTIGGNAADLANHIAHNVGDAVTLSSGTGNLLDQNSMHDNGLLGIDLANDNIVTPNDNAGPSPDGDVGANNLQNWPAILGVFRSGSNFGIVAQLFSTPSTAFVFRFYYSDACDASGNGEGETYIGSAGGATTPAPQGMSIVSPAFPVHVPVGAIITATATDPNGNTSEFSNCSAPAPAFVVNSTNDPGSGVCDGTECTLREAITATNGVAGPDSIHFNIGSGVQTISPGGALPAITDPVIIDGTTQPGFAGTPIIELSGASAGGGVLGLDVSAGGSTIRGLVINSFSTAGIRLTTNGGNTIAGNYIGTNVAGTADLGNSGDGIVIFNSPNNIIGGLTAAGRNLISGNAFNGVLINGGASQGNVVQGNYIGTTAGGSGDLGNTNDGVSIVAASNNTVGGTAAGARNVISGNNQDGVEIEGLAASGNLVQGNYIGTDAGGSADVGNSNNGVSMITDAHDNTVGGTTAAARNVLSGNSVGVSIGTSSDNNTVSGNFIGTDAAGTSALGNSTGISLAGFATNNVIGGAVTGAGNVISGNTVFGYTAGNGASASQILGNHIGTDISHTLDLGNGGDGISFLGDNNVIGGSGAAANFIWNNGGNGIEIGFGTGNQVLGNSIRGNDGLGIDLSPAGVTLNDTGDGDSGPNNLQNFPVLTAAVFDSDQTHVFGTLNSTGSTSFTVRFYHNAACDASGYGEGEREVGSVVVTTNAGGDAAFAVTLNPAALFLLNSHLTATATDPTGNTSEFSQCFLVDGDADNDGDADTADNCPLWANPSQASPEWGSTLGSGPDSDCDRFTNSREVYLGTDPTSQCPANTGLNNEVVDSWPMDTNDNRIANTIDIGLFVFVLNETTAQAGSTRLDFNENGVINTIDVGRYVFVLNKTCSPSGP